MGRDGTQTRDRILEIATALVLDRGFAGTSKGAFFYHFPSKADLARALINRFAERDREVLEQTLARVDKLSRDPLQRLLLFVGLFEEQFAALDSVPAGCLFATYCYEAQALEADTVDVGARAVRLWRERLLGLLREVAAVYPPRLEVDLESLADTFTVVIEGGFVVARILGEPAVLARQLRHYRNYLELLFTPR